jgi:hypothetical protein
MRNALLQMQMQQAQQGMAQQQAVRNALSQHGATEQGANALLGLGAFDQAQMIQKQVEARQQQQRVGSYLDSINPASGVARPFDPMQMLHHTRDPELVKQYADVAMVKPQARNIKEVGGSLVEIPADGTAPKTLYTAPPKPEAPPEVVRLMNFRAGLPAGDPRGPVVDAQIRKMTTHAPGTNVNLAVNTAKTLTAELAGGLGKQLDASLAGANSATQAINTAGTIRELVNSGKIISGPLAERRMDVERIKNSMGVGGKDTAEVLANTGTLIKQLAQSELDAAAQMKGQGALTDAERAILRRAAAGDISLSSPELVAAANAMEKSGRARIRAHRQQVQRLQGVQGAEPLVPFYDVQEPPAAAAPAAPSGGWSIKPK